MNKPLRDAHGRFVSKASEPADGEWLVPDDVWVRFAYRGNAGQGCGNLAISGMVTAKETVKGQNPWMPVWNGMTEDQKAMYHRTYQQNLSPLNGILLNQLEAWMRKNLVGREYSMTFVRYRVPGTARNRGLEPHFKAYEMMLLLEHKMKDVAIRSGDWFNTNHNPPNHLRSYNLVIPGKTYDNREPWVISDADKEVF